jgi:hypothetical protein
LLHLSKQLQTRTSSQRTALKTPRRTYQRVSMDSDREKGDARALCLLGPRTTGLWGSVAASGQPCSGPLA